MAIKPVPEGFHTVTPYLILRDVKGFLAFLQKAFGAKVMYQMDHADGTVMHAQAQIGTSMLMMGGASPEWPEIPASMYLYVEDADATYASSLAAGATSVQEMRDEFYGDRIGGVRDEWGNVWWIATHVEDVSLEELDKRAQQFKSR